MAPWVNRIDHGRFTWRGRQYLLEPNHGLHAIHGVCFDRPWVVDELTETSCKLSISFDERWPFGGRAVQRISLQEDGSLHQQMEVHADTLPFPAGVGWHPWFRRNVLGEHAPRVLVDSDQRYQLEAMIPTGKLLAVTGDFDLRDFPPVATRRLDDCYLNPRLPMRIAWGDLELAISASGNATHAQVYTYDADAVSIEPQTSAIDACNLEARAGTRAGVHIVQDGQPLIATTTWRWTYPT